MNDSTIIFKGYRVEHYAAPDSAVVYTDYCYTPQKYTELCKAHDGLIRNAGPVRNVCVPGNDEYLRVVEAGTLKSKAQKEFECNNNF